MRHEAHLGGTDAQGPIGALPLLLPCPRRASSHSRHTGATTGGEEPPAPPESQELSLPWHALGLDLLGLSQAIGGLALGLIALFSSYDHISFTGRTLLLQQQWGIPFIAASVAVVFVDAELASRSRLRGAQEAARMADEAKRAADEATRRENEAARERNLAGEERNRAAEARERQRQATARQDRCALLSARVLLDPSESNRARLQAFLSLISQAPEDGEEG